MNRGPNIRQRSAIETDLPADVRDDLHRQLLEGMTYEEASSWLAERGYEISKSALGRYGKRFFETCQEARMFSDQARALTSEANEGLPLEEATGKIIMGKILKAITEGDFDILQNGWLLGGIAKMTSASVSLAKYKNDVAAKTKAAAEKATTTLTKAGISEDTIQAVRRDILRIAE